MITLGAMVKNEQRSHTDDLVVRARTDGEALSKLYERYYGPIFGFCVYRLFVREVAEDCGYINTRDPSQRQVSSFTWNSSRFEPEVAAYTWNLPPFKTEMGSCGLAIQKQR